MVTNTNTISTIRDHHRHHDRHHRTCSKSSGGESNTGRSPTARHSAEQRWEPKNDSIPSMPWLPAPKPCEASDENEESGESGESGESSGSGDGGDSTDLAISSVDRRVSVQVVDPLDVTACAPALQSTP